MRSFFIAYEAFDSSDVNISMGSGLIKVDNKLTPLQIVSKADGDALLTAKNANYAVVSVVVTALSEIVASK